jgi:uncharacterized protein (DUF1810 family)
LSLERYIKAQAPVYAQALAELRRGHKQSHWMWYVFPQLAGLGHSAMSHSYAIESLDEAREYLAHPILGGRLRECCRTLMELEGRTAHEIFRSPDDLKFRSSLTLFSQAALEEPLFRELLQKYFGGSPDATTLELLAGQQ